MILYDLHDADAADLKEKLAACPNGHPLHEIRTIDDAAALMEKELIQYVFLDADSRKHGWRDTVRRLRERNPAVRIILLSHDDSHAVSAYEAGAWDYLLTPLKERQICRVFAKMQPAAASAKDMEDNR